MTNVTEQELIAHSDARGAERVTQKDVNDAIVRTEYLNAGPNGLLTVCVLTLWNGFTVLGQSACADPRNFDLSICRRLAHTDAVNKIWALMGYELKSRMERDQQLLSGSTDAPAGFQTFIGTKVVHALPATKDGRDGYSVVYADARNPPYTSWSPKEVFERAYRAVRPAAPASGAEGVSGKASSPVLKGCVAAQVDVLRDEYGPFGPDLWKGGVDA